MSTTVLVIIIMILLSGFFSGTEIAFVSSSRLKQELDLKKNVLPARVLSVFYQNPSRFLGALLLGNNIALVVYGMAMAILLEPWLISILPGVFHSELVILLTQTIISTLIILFTAEFIPKILFRINPNSILKIVAVPVWLFYYLFYPLILFYIGIAEVLLKHVFKIKLATSGYTFSSIDLEEFVKDYNPNVVNQDDINREIQMIQNAIEFKNIKLRDCMVPRTEIEAIELSTPLQQLRELFLQTGHSKIMVYKGSIDKLIGYVHAYDLFDKPREIKEMIRKVDVYPETMSAREVLNIFIKQHKSIAIVVDEFGGTSGIVTMEDIIEEIFGEIEDEYDMDITVEKKIGDDEYIFSTRLEIDYLNDKYKFNLPISDEYETLAGFILHYYESIPAEQEEIAIPPYHFTILKSSNNRLEEVKLRIISYKSSIK
ncbi:MAG TPA: HlyC/CorC family transporter [Bacteroidetes bacterium]|nr:HlyC/CorC family transporter [Bacteroidota bacterium]